jgi:hypothetical protein
MSTQKYVVLLTEPDHFARWNALSDAEQQAVFDAFHDFEKAVVERGGAVLGGEGLADPGAGRTLQPASGGQRLVTSGPYSETVEQLGGFFVVEAATADDVADAARVLPDTWTIDVRPVAGTVQPSDGA